MFFLTTDASHFAIGGVLAQEDEDQNLKPIAYASRTLQKAELNYSTIEKEMLAIVECVMQNFHVYLFGIKFNILSDHKPLQWLQNIKNPNSRLLQWRLRLEPYQYTITHIKGKENYVTDVLSRIMHLSVSNLKFMPLPSCKTILTLISREKLDSQPLFEEIDNTDLQLNQIKEIKMKNQLFLVGLVKEFRPENTPRNILETICELTRAYCQQNQIKKLQLLDLAGIRRQFNALHLEWLLRKNFPYLDPSWAEKLQNANRQQLADLHNDPTLVGH